MGDTPADDELDVGGSGSGMPARLPTEMMDRPPSVDAAANVDVSAAVEAGAEEPTASNPTDDAAETATEAETETEKETAEAGAAATEAVSLEDEYAELDREMAEQIYYLDADGYKMGPCSLEQLTQKYQSHDIDEETEIWRGNETKTD